MPNENVYFAEKELCTGTLNDKLVDDVGEPGERNGQLYKTRKGKGKRKPEAPVATEEVMVFKKGVFQRVSVPVTAIAAPGASDEPVVGGERGHARRFECGGTSGDLGPRERAGLAASVVVARARLRGRILARAERPQLLLGLLL